MGFNLNFHKTVLEARVIFDANRIGGLYLQHVWLAGRGIIFVNSPFRRAASDFRSGPTRRLTASAAVVKINGLGQRYTGQHRDSQYGDYCHSGLPSHRRVHSAD